MTEAQKAQIKNAVMLLLTHGFTVTGPGGKSAGPKMEAAAPVAPKAAAPITVKAAAAPTTKDGRHAYTCGVCGELGHNARTHTAPAAAPAPAKTQAVSPLAKSGAGVKAAPAPVASVALDDLDFDMGDLGGATVNVQPAPVKAAPVKASAPAPKAAAPKVSPPPPAPTPEATDADVDGFLAELDGLDALLP